MNSNLDDVSLFAVFLIFQQKYIKAYKNIETLAEIYK
jgi:hypothetical protein